MSKTITYESKEGYIGKLYGKSSMVIMHKSGTPYLHTGSRTINTYEELKKEVDNYPIFLGILKRISGADIKKESDNNADNN